jgi:hypothetical protein
MSEFKGFEQTREYRFREFLRYTRTRPYVCQPLMKNFWQCFEFNHFDKNVEESEAKTQCLEKFNFEECFKENKDKLYENQAFRVEEISLGGDAGDEDEE